jgi:hypothetical protein
MGATTFKKIDLNRYAKAYPFLRREPKYSLQASSPVSLESAVLDFAGSDEATYTFLNPYSSAPTVSATSMNDSINVFIKSVSTNQVTVGASVANSEQVSIIVVSE